MNPKGADPVLSKGEFYRRWKNDEFGNRSHSFDRVSEVMDSGLPGPFAIRYKSKNSPRCTYNIPRNELPGRVCELVRSGVPELMLEFSPMQKDEHLKIQGEIQLDHRGVCLLYSTEKLPMRTALAKSARQVYGVTASRILEWACDPASRDDLYELLDKYPGHVIEFSSYTRSVGVIPGRNTIVWEVRMF